MKKLLMGVAALSLLAAGAASAQETIVKRGPHQTTVVHKDRYGDRTVTKKFSYRGRSWNRVHGPAWVAPRGYSYRRYTVGAYLPAPFLSASFFVDPVGIGIGLPAAGYGKHWVRVGNDLYLVNGRGRIIEVVPDVYY